MCGYDIIATHSHTTEENRMLYRQTANKYGHPRFAIHFLKLLKADEVHSDLPLDEKYKMALDRSRVLGGKKYHNKNFGGGIIFTTFDEIELERKITELTK